MRTFFTSIFCTLCIFLSAQRNSLFLFWEDFQQNSFINPAWSPDEHDLRLALPHAYYSLQHDGPALGDFVTQDAKQLNINFGMLVNLLEENFTNLSSNLRVDYFNLGAKINDLYIQVNWTFKANAEIRYSRSLAEVLWLGNGPFVGQNLNLSSEVAVQLYDEIGVSISKKIDKLSVGARVKWITGRSDFSLIEPKFFLETRENTFALALDTDFEIRNSSVLDYDGLADFNLSLSDRRLFRGNLGFSFDLGAEYQLDQNLAVGLSIIDIGRITWDRNVEFIRSKTDNVYHGIEIEDIVSIDELDFRFDADTLETILEIENTEGEKYSTDLNQSLNLYFHYTAIKKLQLGAAFEYERTRLQKYINYSLWANFEVSDYFAAGISLNGYRSQILNLGAHISSSLGPFQFFAYTGNVESFFRPFKSKRSNGGLGLNIVF